MAGLTRRPRWVAWIAGFVLVVAAVSVCVVFQDVAARVLAWVPDWAPEAETVAFVAVPPAILVPALLGRLRPPAAHLLAAIFVGLLASGAWALPASFLAEWLGRPGVSAVVLAEGVVLGVYVGVAFWFLTRGFFFGASRHAPRVAVAGDRESGVR